MPAGGRRIVVMVAAAGTAAVAVAAVFVWLDDGADPRSTPRRSGGVDGGEVLYAGDGAVDPEDLPAVVVADPPPALAVPAVVPDGMRPDGVRLPAALEPGQPSSRPAGQFARVLYGDPTLSNPLDGPYLTIERVAVQDCCGSALPSEGEMGFRSVRLTAERDGLRGRRGDLVWVTFQQRDTDTLVTGHQLPPAAVARAAAAATAPPEPPQIPLDALPPGLAPVAAADFGLLDRAGSVVFSDTDRRRQLVVTSTALSPDADLLVALSRNDAAYPYEPGGMKTITVRRPVGDTLAVVTGVELSEADVRAAVDSLVARGPTEWPALESAVMEAPPEFLLPRCGQQSAAILTGSVPPGLAPVPIEWAAGVSPSGVACAGMVSPRGRTVGLTCGETSDAHGEFRYEVVCGVAPAGTVRVRVEDGYGHAVNAALADVPAPRPFFVVLSPPSRTPGAVVTYYDTAGAVIDEQLPPGVGVGACPWTPHAEPCRVPHDVATSP